MAGTVLSGSTYGSALVDVAQMSMRPSFELTFNLLQNQVINRLNTEIERANESTERIDAFLLLEKSRLERVSQGLDQFHVSVGRNHNLLSDMSGEVSDLGATVAAAAAGDPAEFDAMLASLNDSTDRLITVSGIAIGVNVDDGITKMKREGLLTVDDGTGNQVKVTSWADIAALYPDPTDAANAAQAAITAAVGKVVSTLQITDVKLDTVIGMENKAKTALSSTQLQIAAAKTASSAEKTAEIQKLKEKYSYMLEAISMAFEGSAAMADYLGKNLLSPPEVEKGSVMNLFT